MPPSPPTLACPFVLALLTTPLAAQDPGIYADFNVGVLGPGVEIGALSFTIQLDIPGGISDEAAVPRLVANFLRLAEGSAPWIDESSGEVKEEPYFDGLKFYRAIPGNEIYFGSRKDSGPHTDGPGYLVQDDFRSGPLSGYALYMDHDGPNTNGSRFFISVPNNISLNNNYSRLGRVLNISPQFPEVSGFETIVHLTNTGSIIDSEIINSVTIRRVGPIANGFDEHSWLLPEVAATPLQIARGENNTYLLRWPEQPGGSVLYYGSADLQSWTGPFRAFHAPGDPTLGIDITHQVQLVPTAFYRGASTAYPFLPVAQIPLENAILQLGDPIRGQTLFQFNESGLGGTWQRPGLDSGGFSLSFQTTPNPFTTTLRMNLDAGALHLQYTLYCDLDPADNSIKEPSRLSGGTIEFTGPGGTPVLINPFDQGGWFYR